jgi:hypothetical protein
MPQRFHLRNQEQLDNFCAEIGRLWLAGRRDLTVELVPDKRSLPQNDLVHAVYRELAAQMDDQSVMDITRYCKLHLGVPILRRDSDQYRAMYDEAIKGHTYETKLKIMDYWPVTSLMNTEQASEYYEAVCADWFSRGYSIEGQHG